MSDALKKSRKIKILSWKLNLKVIPQEIPVKKRGNSDDMKTEYYAIFIDSLLRP